MTDIDVSRLPDAERSGDGSGSASKPGGHQRLSSHALWNVVMPGALTAAILILLVRSWSGPLTNTDTYFHIRFGEEFLRGHWSLTHPGSVSTFATAHWLPTQWLPEVVMARLFDWFGLAGVAWLSGLQQALLVASLYVVARRWANPLIVLGVLALTLLACSIGLSARPQVLSYLFTAITVGAWLKTRDDLRLRWWLIPMTWLWAMCHGMWPLGIALGVVALVGIQLDTRQGARVLRLAVVPVGSAVAAAVTPVGPGLYHAVLGVSDRSHFFSEWNSPSYTVEPACMMLAVLLAATVILMLRGPGPDWTTILTLLAGIGFALWTYRTIAESAVVVMPLLARAAEQALPGRLLPLRRREAGTVAGVLTAALAVLALIVPHTADRPLAQPGWAQPTLSTLPAGTKVLSGWSYGGYLTWANPQLDLVGHGYGDTFTIPELQLSYDILGANSGWDGKLRSTGATVALLDPSASLAYDLVHLEHWTVMHRSPTLEMLTPPPGWSGDGLTGSFSGAGLGRPRRPAAGPRG